MRDVADLALSMGGAVARSLMVDTCEVVEVAGVTEDPETGKVTPTYGAPVYGPDLAPHRGRCELKMRDALAAEAELAGATVTVQRLIVKVPVGAFTPDVGQLVKVLAAHRDATLVGRVFRVTSVPADSGATACRLTAEEVG